MTFQCKYQVEDYIQAYETYARRSSRRWLTRYLWLIGAVLLTIGVLRSAGPNGSVLGAIPAFLIAVFSFYYAATVWTRAGRRAFVGRPELKQEYIVSADDSGLTFDGPISKLHWAWPAFLKFVESDQLFLAFLSPCAFVILPKRVLGPGGADQLRQVLLEKLSGN